MDKDRESQPNESDGRTKLLSSRPEPDYILVYGLATLIGSVFCILGLFFLVSLTAAKIVFSEINISSPFHKSPNRASHRRSSRCNHYQFYQNLDILVEK